MTIKELIGLLSKFEQDKNVEFFITTLPSPEDDDYECVETRELELEFGYIHNHSDKICIELS